ncbi:MFS transporter [Gordonia sp. L191]|uniref:MFS transporter n=1 Tax=Gordonia sp. L191 TaxID=2982699 RepID=UPI0024C0DAE1|nr:MFS transporter [Gordonia sp. L191]WHU47511.1 MFS transporter [Gordonia sp. L191]
MSVDGVDRDPTRREKAMARRWRGHLLVAVSILACVQFVIVVDETTVGLVAPVIARDLSLGSSARQVLITPFACAFVCGLPVAGLLLRRVVPGRTLAPTVMLFAVSAVAGGCAVTTAQLVVTRAVQGFSAAMVTTGVLAALHAATRADPRRMRAFAGFSLLSGSGALAALLVVGPIADVSWRGCFWGIGAAAAVCALWWVLLARTGASTPGDVGDQVPRAGIDLTTMVAMSAVVATNALLTAAVITASFTLQADRGWSTAMTGMGFLPLNAAAAIGTVMVARSSDRARGGVPAVGAMALAIGGVVITWWACVLGSTQWLLLATIPLGLGVGVVFPLMNSRSMDTAGTLSMGRAAQLGAAAQVGLAVGALVASAQWSFGPAGLASIAAVAVIVDTALRG